MFVYIIDSVEWAMLTPKLLWAQIQAECKAYYDWELVHESCDAFVEALHITKVTGTLNTRRFFKI